MIKKVQNVKTRLVEVRHETIKFDISLPLAAVATPSPSSVGYRPGDMALLGLVMAALLVLCLIVIGFLVSRLWKGNAGMDKICKVSPRRREGV